MSQITKTYRVINGGITKEFVNLVSAMKYQDKHGGLLEFFNGGWYSV